MSQMLHSELSAVEARSFYVRGRNVLMTRAKLGPLFMDYYLHNMQHGIRIQEPADGLLKELLAAMTLHLCSRPQDEVCAWTVSLHQPLLNLFVTGGSRPGRVTGRFFTEDVKDSGRSIINAQTNRPHHQPRHSLVEFAGTDMLRALETFYEQSEQRPTRFFREEDECFSMFSAEPDCDLGWLRSLTDSALPGLEDAERLVPLETRQYVFECGCSIDRLYPLLTRLSDEDLEAVFADGFARITCPRCGAVFNAPREHFEEWQAGRK